MQGAGSRKQGAGSREQGAGRQVHVPVAPTQYVNDYAGAQSLAAAGLGIVALPEIVAAAAVSEGRLQPVLPGWRLSRATLYGISVGGRSAPARVRVFIDFLRKCRMSH